VNAFHKALKFIRGNHGHIVSLAAANYDDLPVLGNLVTESGEIGPGIGIRSLQHLRTSFTCTG
jgi:hypothetical protein